MSSLPPSEPGASMIQYILGILGAMFLGVFGWIFNLGTRVSVLEQKHEDVLPFMSMQFTNMASRLARIEQKLDDM